MVTDSRIAGSRQVKIGMVGEVQHGWLVGCGTIENDELVVVSQMVGDTGFQCAGKTFFAVVGNVDKSNGLLVNTLENIPYYGVKTL
ncbi:hypothetical protein Barb7_02319 [Bacteroidales bacterium Barb7]|nr:hypothetical protein Barb7_02319 [Bacteroidales bacterium Barb7]